MPLAEGLLEKIHRHTRLDETDLKLLFTCRDTIGIGYFAELYNKQNSQDRVFYYEHKYLRCVATDGRFHQILHQAAELVGNQTREIRLVSINPNKVSLTQLCDLIYELKYRFPHCLLRALSANQLLRYNGLDRQRDLASIVQDLKKAGLTHIEGRPLRFKNPKHSSPADIPAEWQLNQSSSFELWLRVHQIAHEAGMTSNATLEYSSHEALEARIKKLVAIRLLQDKTQGFDCFLPINKRLVENHFEAHPSLVLDDLRTLAIARLFLDNFARIKAPWGRLGVNVAQLALSFGANEFEGSVSNDNNSRIAGARPFRSMNRDEIRSIIGKAKFIAEEVVQPLELNHRLIKGQKTSGNPQAGRTTTMLYKMSRQAAIDPEERIVLCREASLMALGTCALETKSRMMPPHHLGILGATQYLQISELPYLLTLNPSGFRDRLNLTGTPPTTTVLIDLGGPWQDFTQLNQFEEFVERLHGTQAAIELVVLGLKGLWRLTDIEGLSLIRLAERLKKYQVVAVESSSLEAEDDLTLSEVASTHSILHQMDIATVGKLELAAPYHGQGDPFWEKYLSRIDLFNAIQRSTHGLLGIKVEAAQGAYLTPAEYLRAVAICRIFLQGIPNIITPIEQFPLINLTKNALTRNQVRIARKLSPLSTFFGSNDLMLLPQSEKHLKAYQSELESMGLSLQQRNARFHSY